MSNDNTTTMLTGKKLKGLSVAELMEVDHLLSRHIGEPEAEHGEPTEGKRDEFYANTRKLLDGLKLFVGRDTQSGKLLLMPQSKTKVDPLCAANVTMLAPGEEPNPVDVANGDATVKAEKPRRTVVAKEDKDFNRLVRAAKKRTVATRKAKAVAEPATETPSVAPDPAQKASKASKPSTALPDDTKIKAGKSTTGALSQKRTGIIKDGMTVGEWREKIISSKLAPAADKEGWALLGHLVRQGHIVVE